MIKKMLEWSGIVKFADTDEEIKQLLDEKWPIGDYINMDSEASQMDFGKIDDVYIQGRHYTEAEVRDIVGAPTKEESEMCTCGKELDACTESYTHMSKGF